MEFFTKCAEILMDYHQQLIQGVINTLLVAIIGTVIGLIIGLFIGGLRYICKNEDIQDTSLSKRLKKIGYALTGIYVSIFRGTPMLVQAMFIYWSLKGVIGWTAFQAAIVIISINTGAYLSEVIRAGIQSVDKGQNEAARSLGLSSFQSMRYVVLPQAIKNAFPSIGNELVVNIKDSCVLNAIGFAELFFQAKSISGSMFDYSSAYFVVGCIYFILIFIASKGLLWIEKKIGLPQTDFNHSVTTPQGEK